MAEEGVVEATWTSAKAHPWIVGGAVLALVGLFWYMSSSGGSASSGQNFSFSYGPTNAEVLGNDALQAQQATDQMQASVAQSYFQYLGVNGAATNNANVAIAGINSTTALGVSHDANSTAIDRKSTRLNSSHIQKSRMPSSA